MASRMVARSTMQGTPVKSCMITRAGVNWISLSGSAFGSQFASARMWSAVMLAPSSVRSRFSSSTFRLKGSLRRPPPRRSGRCRSLAIDREGRPRPEAVLAGCHCLRLFSLVVLAGVTRRLPARVATLDHPSPPRSPTSGAGCAPPVTSDTPHTVDGVSDKAPGWLTTALPDHRAHRRRHLHRHRHPRLPRPAGRMDPRPRGREALHALATTSPTPTSGGAPGRSGCATRPGRRSPTPGHRALVDLQRQGRLRRRAHPEHRRAAPARGLRPGTCIEFHGTVHEVVLPRLRRRTPMRGRWTGSRPVTRSVVPGCGGILKSATIASARRWTARWWTPPWPPRPTATCSWRSAPR